MPPACWRHAAKFNGMPIVFWHATSMPIACYQHAIGMLILGKTNGIVFWHAMRHAKNLFLSPKIYIACQWDDHGMPLACRRYAIGMQHAAWHADQHAKWHAINFCELVLFHFK